MKILVADKVSPDMISDMESLGGVVTYNPELKAEELPDVIADAVVLIVRSTKVSAETIAAGSGLRLVIRAGAGVNTIDIDAASDHGVYVANCPGMNTDAVAELALGLLIAADRQIPNATAALRGGEWLKGQFGKARGLRGRTLGVIGMGQIGQRLAKHASSLGMQVIGWSRSLTDERAEAMGVGRATDVVELAAKADAISIHLASTPETKHILSSDFFAALQPGSIVVNTARGEVIDTDAMAAAIREKGLRVALDVFENEPSGGKADFPHTEIAELVVCTPHIGASTDQASQAIGSETIRILQEFVRTGCPINVVNMRAPAEDKTHLVVRHYNRVGVLARILKALRDQGINVEEMGNSVFKTGTAAMCTLILDAAPTDVTLDVVREDDDVIAAEVMA